MTSPNRLAAVWILCLAGLAGSVRAQGDGEPLQLQGVALGGTRTSVTEAWGTAYVTVANTSATAREARVVLFYQNQPDVQFGRDLWVPAGSAMTAWLPIGPAPAARSQIGRELEILLFERTGGQNRLVLPPSDERVRTRAFFYRSRTPTTALFVDLSPDDPSAITRADTAPGEALLFAHIIRHVNGMPEQMSVVTDGYLPPTPEAFDGIDQVILAGNRLRHDPPGRAALRQWVEQGGRLLVMLDQVDPEVIAPIFGRDLHLQVIDRVSLTTVVIHRARDGSAAATAPEFERPVDFVRVVPTAGAVVPYTVNGWPASFVLQVGRGKVVFTTLGPRGWHRPRRAGESRSPYERRPDLPVAHLPLEDVAAELRPRTGPTAPSADDLRPLLTEEIGYTIVNRRTAAAILGGFVLALAALAFGLRRARRPENVGWLAPAAALGAAGLFIGLGEGSRRSVPPTVAVVEVVDAVPSTGELAVNGLFAVYQPSSGPALLATRDGALLDLDQEGLEGQTRRRMQVDQEAWHWENISLPAGVRSGPFRYTAPAVGMRVVARFGASGVEGRLNSGAFVNPSDALITSSGREFIAAGLGADGQFAAGLVDMLPAGQFLPGSVLSDRQQRRQEVYRQLFAGKMPAHMEGRDLLLAWAEPRDLPFAAPDGARKVGTALLIVPVEFERPAAGTSVTIPRAFISFRRFSDGVLLHPTLEGGNAVDQRLRFQLPPSVLPLTVERATLTLKIRAPARRLTVSGFADGRAVPLFDGEGPAEALRLEIADASLLRPDVQGGLHLQVAVGEGGGTGEGKWTIEALGLDVVGRTDGNR